MDVAMIYGLIIAGIVLISGGVIVAGKAMWTLYKMYKKYGWKGMFKND